jgi:spectinomycin phosphotransferase
MRDDPGLDLDEIAACLATEYGLRAAGMTYLPIGYDMNAAVYEVRASDGRACFLKVRFGPVHEAGLLAPRALTDLGVTNVLAALPARSGRLWAPLDGNSVVLYPFVRGENAMDAGLSAEQWREFGATLRAVHDSGLEVRFLDLLPVERFTLPSAALVRRLTAQLESLRPTSPAALELAAFWRENAGRIRALLARAEELGRRLQARSFALVLCHADIHAANILVGEDGAIHLIDWDGPRIAPRERDLLFVIGSHIARDVAPWEEEAFFAGYGPVPVNAEALAYFRYERAVEDVGEFGKTVFLDASISETSRREQAGLLMGYFAPGGMIDTAERVVVHQPAGN